MKAVVVGEGAREHALAWGLAKSAQVVVTPGNDGMAAQGMTCVATPATSLDADLFVIGPETPLAGGLADELRAQGKVVLGPGRDGARLEGSKAYMKEFLAAAKIPTAAYGVFDNASEAEDFLATMTPPYVVKTDGLAAGKGVLVTSSLDEARRDVRAKLSGEAFGDAGSRVIIEEGLSGYECSLHVLFDGERAYPLVPAQDFKRVGDGDTGANTGGMGAFAPLRSVSASLVDEVMTAIIAPTVVELRSRGIDYRGVLYAGLMMTSTGPKLLEYNVRFGDPETQVLVPLLGDNLFDALYDTARGELYDQPASYADSVVTVVLASPGYPLAPTYGARIAGLASNGQIEGHDVMVFHAGTKRVGGDFVSAGGRVLCVSARATTLDVARRKAYDAASLVRFEGRVMRSDIAANAQKELS